MKALSIALLIVMLTVAACIIPTGRGGFIVVPPPLPPIVEIGPDPYYYQSGYHYHYRDNSWYYSNSRSGPWEPLPRDHYPKETRLKGKGEGNQGPGREHGPDNAPGRDQRDRD